MKLVESLWSVFDHAVIPATASEVQRREMRNAFFAGAHGLFHVMMAMLDPGTEPTEEDLRNMDRLAAELQAWEASVQVPQTSTGQA